MRQSSTKKVLTAHLDSYILAMLPEGEKVSKEKRDMALDAVCATGVPWGRTERMRRITSGKYLAIA